MAFSCTEFGHLYILNPSFIKSLESFGNLYSYTEWWYDNYQLISFEYNNYFIVRFLASIFIPILLYISLIIIFREKIYNLRPFKKTESIHGDAKWASEADIKKAGLRVKKGMLVGQDKSGYLVAAGYQHLLLFAFGFSSLE